MADTIRDRPALLALLADNTTGNITPQHMRDVVVSVFGVYSSIYCVDASTAQSGIGTSDVKVTGFTANGPNVAGMTPDHTNDQITVDVDGVYLCLFQCSFSGSGNTEFTFTMYVNGVATDSRCIRKMGTGGDVGSTFFAGGAAATAGQTVDVRVKSDGGSNSITPVHMALGMFKLS